MRSLESHSRLPGKRRRGTILVLMALLLPAFLLIVGFSIDLAHIQLSRTEMRLAVDAAARAGAEELARTESISKAKDRAKAVAAMNPVAGKTLSLRDSDINFGRASLNANGAYDFALNQSPSNSVKVVGLRSSDAIDGQLKFLMGWYSQNPGVDLSVPAVAAFRSNDIGLVLDRSTSMKQSITGVAGPSYNSRFCKPPRKDTGWFALDAAVAVFLQQIKATPAEERVSLVTFSSDIDPGYCGALPAATLDQGLTANISDAENAMSNLMNSVWNGNTNIAAGITCSQMELVKGPAARSLSEKFMLVMTDGNANEGDHIAAATEAAKDGIKISTITFGPDADQDEMRKVAQIGGGVHYHATDAAQLLEVFNQFAAQSALIVQ